MGAIAARCGVGILRVNVIPTTCRLIAFSGDLNSVFKKGETMYGLLVLLVVVVVIIAVVLALLKNNKGAAVDDAPWPYYAKQPLSSPEQQLYFRLCRALPDHIVLAQVGLSRILGVKKGSNFGQWSNRINRMSADFVLCSRNSTVVAVIELDDSSHERADRQAADGKKDRAVKSAGIRMVRWNVKAMPDEAAIRAAFQADAATKPTRTSGQPPTVRGRPNSTS